MGFGEALRRLFDFGDGVGIEQLAEVGLAEEFAKLILIDGESLGAAFGQWGIAVVKEVGDVAEEKRRGEGRGLAGLDDVDAELPLLDVLEDLDQGRHVEDVAEALAIGLEQERERRIARGDAEQIVGALAQLPERRAGVGAAARQQESAAGGFAESCRRRAPWSPAGAATSCMASADSTRNQSGSGGSSVSGKRRTKPSSPHRVSTSGPPAARICAR